MVTMKIIAMVTVFLIKMLMVEIMLFLTMCPGQMCRTGSFPRSSYVTLTFAGFLFFAHTLAQKHKLGPISKLAQISQNRKTFCKRDQVTIIRPQYGINFSNPPIVNFAWKGKIEIFLECTIFLQLLCSP